jgi:hypothetical protein
MARRSGLGMVLGGGTIFKNSHSHQSWITILSYIQMGLDRVKIKLRNGDTGMSFGAEFLRM